MNATERLSAHPWLEALLGALLVVPFVAVNAVVGRRIEPLFSVLRPGPHAGPFEYVVLAAVLVLLPLGAGVALLPLQRAAPGRFGNILSQSGSFWRKSGSELDADAEWPTRRHTRGPRRPLRFCVEIGPQEWALLPQTRHDRDVMPAPRSTRAGRPPATGD